jgi:hypothetical protein
MEIRHFHPFAALGGGASGSSKARIGRIQPRFRCRGDIDAAALRDFQPLAGARGTVLDLFNRQLYRDSNGREPPSDWCEATLSKPTLIGVRGPATTVALWSGLRAPP